MRSSCYRSAVTGAFGLKDKLCLAWALAACMTAAASGHRALAQNAVANPDPKPGLNSAATPPRQPSTPPVSAPAPAPAARVFQEPPQKPVPDSLRSEDLKTYEKSVTDRLNNSIKAIAALSSRIDGLNEEDKAKALPHLRTAEGNRSAARTKIKQLKFVQKDQWLVLRTGIEKALTDLEDSVNIATQKMP